MYQACVLTKSKCKLFADIKFFTDFTSSDLVGTSIRD